MAAEPRPPLAARKKLVSVVEETVSGTFESGGTFTPVAAVLMDIKCDPGDFFNEGTREPSGNYLGETTAVLGKQMASLGFSMQVPPGVILPYLTAAGYKSNTGTYKPSSDLSTRKTWSAKVWEDGILKTAAGLAAKISLEVEIGKILMAKFDYSGIWGTVTDAAMSAQSVITAQPYICRGITSTFGGSAIAQWSKATIDLGAEVEERVGQGASSGISHYLVPEIKPTIKLDPEARKVADQDNYGAFLAGTAFALVFVFTSGANTLTITAPAAQRRKVTSGARGKIATHELELACCVSSGDDALSLVEA